jgi:hypothetical protein
MGFNSFFPTITFAKKIKFKNNFFSLPISFHKSCTKHGWQTHVHSIHFLPITILQLMHLETSHPIHKLFFSYIQTWFLLKILQVQLQRLNKLGMDLCDDQLLIFLYPKRLHNTSIVTFNNIANLNIMLIKTSNITWSC